MSDAGLLALNIYWQVATLGFIALGLAIIFGLLRVMNMAHGEFVMLGAYAPIITSTFGLNPWLQIPICILTVGLFALVTERLIIRHLYDRMFDSLLATWGLSILIRKIVEVFFGRGYQSVESPLPGTSEILGVVYPTYRLILLVLITAFFVLLFVWYRYSSMANRIRAMVFNPPLAKAIGINTTHLAALTFVVGCVSAGLAGLMLAPLVRVEPFMGLDYLLRSFFILVIGGLGTLEGLGIGAGVIGGIQSVISSLTDQTGGYLAVLIVSILFLWLRPSGLYSRK